MPETAPYLTLSSERVQALPEETRAELLGWLQDVAPDPDVVYRVTFDPNVTGGAPLYITEIERDESSPVLARVTTVPGPAAPPLPDHLREQFEPCDDFL